MKQYCVVQRGHLKLICCENGANRLQAYSEYIFALSSKPKLFNRKMLASSRYRGLLAIQHYNPKFIPTSSTEGRIQHNVWPYPPTHSFYNQCDRCLQVVRLTTFIVT